MDCYPRLRPPAPPVPAALKALLIIASAVLTTLFAACQRKEERAVTSPPAYRPAEKAPAGLTPDDALLLTIARRTLKEAVAGGRRYEPDPPASPALLEPRGVFVTLKKGGDLRGCIGYVLPTKPLYLAVRDNAINAALEDPRFMPVQEGELDDLYIEISVMTPLQPVANPEEIVVGQDGLVIEGRGRVGLLLPQVAPEQGWDREQFLEGVCMKAGLSPGAYRSREVKLSKFQAHVFGGPYRDERGEVK